MRNPFGQTLLKFLSGLAILLTLIYLVFILNQDPGQVQARLITTPVDPSGFARADGPRPLKFPDDHGPHPEYQTEWWYYTGNVQTNEGRQFGFQLTFFRRALLPSHELQPRASNWGTDQVYMAHFAVTDVATGRFHTFERLSRGAAGLAGAQSPPYHVWLDDWSVSQVGEDNYNLQADAGEVALDLLLADSKGPILQGDQGYSPKGPDPGNASYYISQTRLVAQGTVRLGDTAYAVAGSSWMDHEFSTSALTADQVGWDWFALQMDDGSELMVFQIRKDPEMSADTIDPFSSGTLISPDGSSLHLARDDFEITVQDTWRSPHSQAVYPARWRILVPSAGINLEVEPLIPDQELNLSFTYWEGAVRLQGERAGQAISGFGYVELTGYAGSMAGQF
jgi:predicted secreted hydrolase